MALRRLSAFALRRLSAFALPLALTSCLLDPFVDEQMSGNLHTTKIQEGREKYLAVCYNASYTTPEAITALAREECDRRGLGPTVSLLGQMFWQCRLFIPTKAYFKCTAPGVPDTPKTDTHKSKHKRHKSGK